VPRGRVHSGGRVRGLAVSPFSQNPCETVSIRFERGSASHGSNDGRSGDGVAFQSALNAALLLTGKIEVKPDGGIKFQSALNAALLLTD
jgi:hypothetical protein